MQHFPQEQTKELASLGLEGIRACLPETVRSENGQAPSAAGFFRMAAGESQECACSCDERELLLEGGLPLAVQDGATAALPPGGVAFFAKGATATFSAASSGPVFYVGQRKLGEL